MKYFNILTLLLISSVLSFYACNDNTEAVRKEARESLEGPGSAALPDATAANPPAAEPLQNADGVWHYICNNGCPLAHNTAYHAPAGSTPATSPITPSGTPPAPTPPTTEPAQNAAGVWHYTCGNGCAGGAGTATACSSCGSTLAHNPAYHQ